MLGFLENFELARRLFRPCFHIKKFTFLAFTAISHPLSRSFSLKHTDLKRTRTHPHNHTRSLTQEHPSAADSLFFYPTFSILLFVHKEKNAPPASKQAFSFALVFVAFSVLSFALPFFSLSLSLSLCIFLSALSSCLYFSLPFFLSFNLSFPFVFLSPYLTVYVFLSPCLSLFSSLLLFILRNSQSFRFSLTHFFSSYTSLILSFSSILQCLSLFSVYLLVFLSFLSSFLFLIQTLLRFSRILTCI